MGHCARTFELDVDSGRSTLSRVVTGKLNGRTTTGPCRSFNAMMLRGFPGPNISHFYRLFLFSTNKKLGEILDENRSKQQAPLTAK